MKARAVTCSLMRFSYLTRSKNEDVDESLVPEEDGDMLYTTFYDILNDLMTRSNLDIYVTGSNYKTLSTDIDANFRDRSTDIKVYPLSII